GSVVSHQLIEKGHKVIVYDNFSTGYKEALHQNCKFVLGDVRDRELPARVMRDNKVDLVLHFAAKLNVPESIINPLDYYDNNFLGTLNLLQCCERSGVSKFIFSSTAAVYGDTQKKLVSEDDDLKPINPYGESKFFSERALFSQSKTNKMNFISLRYFNVSGASNDLSLGQRSLGSFNLIKNLCDVVLGYKEQLEVFGADFPTPDGFGVRDYIHVEDLAAAHVVAAEKLYDSQGLVNEVYNCGYGKGYSVKEVIDAFSRITGKAVPYTIRPRRAGDPAAVVADVSKIKAELSWKPQNEDLYKICESTLNWFKKTRNA
ncbi:MAG: UDP-glucose 4-epimerase GalE, partial [Bdellovibrionaceae bacterium]|nr:UDP-glucose 4-epimerase GalE [Pseudobdellovibrionaceae bacterium]